MVLAARGKPGGETGPVRYESPDKPRATTSAEPTGPGGTKNAGIAAGGAATVAHRQNFFDCRRTRKEPNCPFEIGFRSAIAYYRAIASYREKRTVRWDEKAEEVV